MISIQELGLQVYSDTPGKFYVFGGNEYGIKDKYISILKKHYGGAMKECESVQPILDMMSTHLMFAPKPSLYVVRYDTDFVSKINDKLAAVIRKANIIGTIVCIYEDNKSLDKLDKYIPEYTCSIPQVNNDLVYKYLHSEFPSLSDKQLRTAINSTVSYGHARTVCTSMTYMDSKKADTMSDKELSSAFGCDTRSIEDQFRAGFAGRDFRYLVNMLDEYTGDIPSLIYVLMQTLIDLEKILGKKYSDSPLHQYVRGWTAQDIYYMFMHCYRELELSRSSQGYQAYSSLVYLFGLLTFQHIPNLEAME